MKNIIAALVGVFVVSCGDSLTPLELTFDPPSVPGEVVTSGVTFRASAETVQNSPTTVRVTVVASNETAAPQAAVILGGPGCMVRVRAYWRENPSGQQLAPDPATACFGVGVSIELAPGEVRTLPVIHEVTPSAALGAAFVPGVYFFSAVIQDDVEFEFSAGLANVQR